MRPDTDFLFFIYGGQRDRAGQRHIYWRRRAGDNVRFQRAASFDQALPVGRLICRFSLNAEL